jgi:hypothetical protein
MAATCSEGEQFRATMMVRRKRKRSSEDQVEEDGYELSDSNTNVMGECTGSQVCKWHRMDLFCRTTSETSTRLDEIFMAMEEQQKELLQHHKELHQHHQESLNVQKQARDIQQRAVDIQEHTSHALLDILCQSLLPPHL